MFFIWFFMKKQYQLLIHVQIEPLFFLKNVKTVDIISEQDQSYHTTILTRGPRGPESLT